MRKKSKHRTEEQIKYDIATGTKVCTVCKERKTFIEFSKLKVSPDNRNYRCRICDSEVGNAYRKRHPESFRRTSRNTNLKQRFGITIEDYEEILEQQEGVCGICGGTETRNLGKDNKQSFSVDHCHETGKIRGLLCNNCNRGLGLLGDTEVAIEKALNYLRKEVH